MVNRRQTVWPRGERASTFAICGTNTSNAPNDMKMLIAKAKVASSLAASL